MSPKTFVFIGRSGCGKGTQVKLLSEVLQTSGTLPIYYIESGATFREFIAKEGYTNKMAREVQEGGWLQPEFLSIWVWTNLLIKEYQDPMRHLIFDGTVRKEHEGPVFDAAMDFYGRKERYVIHIDVSEEWSRARMLERKRPDDTEEYINRRLAWFKTDVVPVLKYFSGSPKYKFIEVNGGQSVEKVHADIISALKQNGFN
ncbi:MAG: nucleoside monophosphate kinase [Patescibacteria group bacterium]